MTTDTENQKRLKQLGELVLKDGEGDLVFCSPIRNICGKNVFHVCNPQTGACYRVVFSIREIPPPTGQGPIENILDGLQEGVQYLSDKELERELQDLGHDTKGFLKRTDKMVRSALDAQARAEIDAEHFRKTKQ